MRQATKQQHKCIHLAKAFPISWMTSRVSDPSTSRLSVPVHLGDTEPELAAPPISCLGSHLGHPTTQVAVNVRHEMPAPRPKLVTAHACGSSRFLRPNAQTQHGADPRPLSRQKLRLLRVHPRTSRFFRCFAARIRFPGTGTGSITSCIINGESTPSFFTGWTTPISLFTSTTETSPVVGLIADSRPTGFTSQSFWAGRKVTSKLLLWSALALSITHLCPISQILLGTQFTEIVPRNYRSDAFL